MLKNDIYYYNCILLCLIVHYRIIGMNFCAWFSLNIITGGLHTGFDYPQNPYAVESVSPEVIEIKKQKDIQKDVLLPQHTEVSHRSKAIATYVAMA